MSGITLSDQTSQHLEDAIRLGKDGMFLDALDQLRRCGPLRDWTGASRVEVAWIVAELGAPRLSRWHNLKAYREVPNSLSARNAYGYMIAAEQGPYDTLQYLESHSEPVEDAPPDEQQRWQWLRASSLTNLRDFSNAEVVIERMERNGYRPEIPLFARAFWLEKQDRYDEALAAIDAAFAIYQSRSIIGYKAHLLSLLSRDEEAYALLAEFDSKKQVASFSWQMSAFAYEQRNYAECGRLLQRFESLSPLLEPAFGEQFTMFRVELARRNGDDDGAIQYAKRLKSSYGNELAEKLADPARKSRVDKILPVNFVRQHELTCGPATLTAIAGYWGREAEHLEVAEEICYNGTTNHSERHWAEQNGYHTIEFTVTEEITEALIGREVPFTLVTRGAGYAHLQAVIGYDGRTGTILIRDPYTRVRGSAAADKLLEDQAAYGPRGMVLVPRDQMELIDGIQFPDAKLYDLLHALDGALIDHDRPNAVRLLDDMRKLAPNHRLHWTAKRQLAEYDGDELGSLKAVQGLITLYPEEVSLQISELSMLRSLGRESERIQRLRELVAKPNPHPLLKTLLADSLVLDGRFRDEAHDFLREAIRGSWTYARNYSALGDLLWSRYQRDPAQLLYRFAACLEDRDEYLASQYFNACAALGQTDQALEWLRGRFARFGKKSMQPGLTLHHALARLRRHQESIEVLEQALKRRPDDPSLVLAVAQCLAETSGEHWDHAEQLLQSVRETAPERQWYETASQLAVMKGDWETGLEHLEHLLPRSPLSMGLREQITDLIFQIQGEEAAIAHWRTAANEFPHYRPIVERYAIALRDRPLSEVQPVLQQILQDHSDNAWAVREMAQHLLAAGKLDEAQDLVDRAVELDGEHSFTVSLQASLDVRRGNNKSARERLRKVLQNDISNDFVVSKLLDACESGDEQKEELAWVLEQLRVQPTTGEVVSLYRSYAEAIVPAEELCASLREAREARKDLWQVHQSLIRQLTQMQKLDEAAEEAQNATQQFPLEPNAWFEQYRVAAAVGDHAAQRTALERCRLLRPTNATIVRALADLECNEGQYDKAKELLEPLVSQQPLDAISQVYFGDVSAELQDDEAALLSFRNAVRLRPDYDYAWNQLDAVAHRLDRPDERMELARKLTEDQPHLTSTWLEYARCLILNEDFERATIALDRAEQIDPYLEAIYSVRARLLANSGDFEAALAALQPPIFAKIPPDLQSARAQLLWDIGRQDEAYRMVRKMAQENPAATGIWSRLEHWAMLRGDKKQALEAIEHQVKLNPHDPDVLDAAGNRFVDLGRKGSAIKAFRRAIEINPTYGGSRCRLFDLLIERNEWDQASEIIRNLPRSDQHPAVLLRRMQLSMQEKDHAQAEKDFAAILNSEEWSTWAVDRGVDLMIKAGKWSVMDDLVEKGLANNDSDGGFGALLVRLAFLSRRLPMKQRVEQLADRIRRMIAGEHVAAGRLALSELMQNLSQKGQESWMKRFISNNEAWLRDDTYSWSLVAYGFVGCPKSIKKRQMRDWLDGWQKREGYEPWMLTNVHELWRILAEPQEAREAIRLALGLTPDHTQSQLRLWAAHDALVDGDSKLALKHFMLSARVENLEGLDAVMHQWVEAVLHAQQSQNKQASFRELRHHLSKRTVTSDFFVQQPAYRLVYEKTLTMIADAIGTPSAKLWLLPKLLNLKLAKWGFTLS